MLITIPPEKMRVTKLVF